MNKNKKSLRTILTLWFLTFGIVPLTFLSGYSIKLYESALNSELQKRLLGNIREVGVNLADLENMLLNHGRIHASDPSLVYYVATRNTPSARRVVNEWLKTYVGSRIVLFDREGRLIVSHSRSSNGEIKPQTNLESGDVFLSDKLIKDIESEGQVTVREVKPEKGLSLVVYTRVVQKGNQTAGYLEEVAELGQNFVEGLKRRLNLEATIFDENSLPTVSSNKDFQLYPKTFFPSKIAPDGQGFFDLTSRGEPFGMIVRKIVDPKKRPYAILGLAASKRDSQSVLWRIQITMFSVTTLILILLIPTLIYVSNRVVKPIHALVEAAQKMESGEAVGVKGGSETEIGILIEAFNKMSKNISTARRELEKKIAEVEKANAELKSTQSTLIHSAKMASVGQLVAGVAHELNNPIGFIYSNMSHLREYAEKLKLVLDTAEKKPNDLIKIKKQVDFDYIIEDLPKLIASCEDGARRTRDIVTGLRNFSRLDEAQLKRADIHEGLKNTIKLLSGELKNRIKVHEDYQPVKEVRCYVSQLNQVFMNIISNAAQAIEKSGQIWIKTWQEGSWAYVSIKDSGPGIDKKNLDKIFDPFFTTKEVGRGTGLGLSISYGIIQKHGGDISVESQLGHGAQFTIKLPLDGPADDRSQAPS